jgi:hypothetical protein
MYGTVCAYSGWKAQYTYDLSNAVRTAEKPWNYGDLAIEYLIDEMRYESEEDFLDALKSWGVDVEECDPLCSACGDATKPEDLIDDYCATCQAEALL